MLIKLTQGLLNHLAYHSMWNVEDLRGGVTDFEMSPPPFKQKHVKAKFPDTHTQVLFDSGF